MSPSVLTTSAKVGALLALAAGAVSLILGAELCALVLAALAVGFFIAWRRREDGKSRSWRALGDLFEKLAVSEITSSHRLHARAVVFPDHAPPPEKTWDIDGADKDCLRDAELLCARAGALLRSCTKVSATLALQARSALNDRDRWLYFLNEIEERPPAKDGWAHSGLDRDGRPTPPIYLSIDSVTKSSLRGCAECLRREGGVSHARRGTLWEVQR